MLRKRHTVGFVFDLDGTLVDSEPLCEAAWASTLAYFGSRLTSCEAEWTVGKTTQECANYLAASRPLLPDLPTLTRTYADTLAVSMSQNLRTFPDALLAIEWLRAEGIPVGIATNSHRARLNNALELTNPKLPLLPSTAADEVALPKPAPDVFLQTAQKLGVPGHLCIAVEDSDTGHQAAAAAGMEVIRVDCLGRSDSTLLRECQQRVALRS